MNAFQEKMNVHQVQWRKQCVATKEHGRQNGIQRAWILPKNRWEDGLWSGIRSGSHNDLVAYLHKNQIQRHQGVHNLKSSWVLCANLYFAHRHDTELLGRFLADRIHPDIVAVERLELEYTEAPPLDPASLLCEPPGRRGANQTSPDVAFVVRLANRSKGLILTEIKFTEHSFCPCTGRKKGYGNPDTTRCLEPSLVLDDPKTHCHLLNWSNERRKDRKYWQLLNLSRIGRQALCRCPAATAGYQLFRQQALAEAIAIHGTYDLVISAVAYDHRNRALLRCLKTSGIDQFPTGWGSLFKGKARSASFTHQEWFQWVRTHDTRKIWEDWCRWVSLRYGY